MISSKNKLEYNRKYKLLHKEENNRKERERYWRNKEKVSRRHKAYYERNKTRLTKLYKENDLKHKEEWLPLLNDLSLLSCFRCGYNEFSSALEYHHLEPEEKEYNMSYLFRLIKTDRRILELKKTICLCSNCHRALHANLWVLEVSPDAIKAMIRNKQETREKAKLEMVKSTEDEYQKTIKVKNIKI